MAAIDRQRDYIDGDNSEGGYLVIQEARDTSTVQCKYRMQLTRSRLSSDENLCPRTDERHLLHSLDFSFASTGQDL